MFQPSLFAVRRHCTEIDRGHHRGHERTHGMGRDKGAHDRHAYTQHEDGNQESFGPTQEPTGQPLVQSHVHHGHTHGQDPQQEHGGIACKGFAYHTAGKKMEEVGENRHEDPSQPNRDRFSGKKDDGHGNDAKHDHGFVSRFSRVMGHFPLDHLLCKTVLFHRIDNALWRGQNKPNQDKNTGPNTDP